MQGRDKDFNKGKFIKKEIIKNLTLWPKLNKFYSGNNSKTPADNITFTFYLNRLWDPNLLYTLYSKLSEIPLYALEWDTSFYCRF